MDLIDAIGRWIKTYGAELEDWNLWIDIFVVNQHSEESNEALNFELFANGFEDALKCIGRSIIVLSPWDKPTWMQRAWCLFEFCIIMSCKLEYQFVLPEVDVSNFIKSLGTEGNQYLQLVATLDMANATAYSAYDERHIKQLVKQSLGGFAKLNESVVEAIRKFCVQQSSEALAGMSASDKASSRLLFNTASLLCDVGDHDRALALFQEDLALRAGSAGAAHPSVAAALQGLGVVYSKLGRLEEALHHHRRALAIETAAVGQGRASLGVASALKNIGVICRKQGRLDEALDNYRRALEVRVPAYYQALHESERYRGPRESGARGGRRR